MKTIYYQNQLPKLKLNKEDLICRSVIAHYLLKENPFLELKNLDTEVNKWIDKNIEYKESIKNEPWKLGEYNDKLENIVKDYVLNGKLIPINLLGKQLVNKKGETFTIEKQEDEYGEHLILNNGITYAYSKIFISQSFSALDEYLQNKIQTSLRIEKARQNIKQEYKDAEQIRLSELKMINDLKNREIYGKNISYEDAKVLSIEPKLYYGKIYGTKALDIYNSCCRNLKFDKNKSDSFDLRQILYAQNCTPEGYSVWLLPHSNLTGDIDISQSWINFVDIDKNEIVEYNYVYDGNEKHELEKRVTFVKQGNYKYVFLGVYELTEEIIDYPDSNIVKQIHTLVSKNYPCEE